MEEEHHVFAVGDVSTGIFDLQITGESHAGMGKQVPNDSVNFPLIIQQGKRLGILLAGIVLNHHRAQAVDGPEGELVRIRFTEQAGKALFHIPRGGNRIGDGQDALGRDASAIEHIPQPGNQHSGFAASRDSQQKDGPFGLLNGFLLLAVEADGVVLLEFFVGHGWLQITILMNRKRERR